MKRFSIYTFSLIILIMGCQGGHRPSDAPGGAQADSTVHDTGTVADSTIYGVSGEFGMSTFTLISDSGDTLNVCRTAEDGTDGAVYGDLREGERYAMTTRDNNEAIGVLINLTQLGRHLKNYEIANGQLFIDGRAAQISSLNDNELKLK